MGLKCGIVGLPNVGKSTLFNALGSAKAEAANYPFCTIEPNVGVVNVPDENLGKLAQIFKSDKILPSVTEIVDIAGIVKGASQGEGLGNQFLQHIREVDAILHVVRCFKNDDIIHVEGSIDPKRDIDVIQTELCLADLQTIEKKLERERRASKTGDKEAKKNEELLSQLYQLLNEGKPARALPVEESRLPYFKSLFLLTAKPMLYVINTTNKAEERPWVEWVEKYAVQERAKSIQIDCALEAEIASLEESEKKEFLEGMGLKEPGLNRLIQSAFDLLGLMNYYTAGPKETRAWTIHKGSKAPQAAGVIHSDFERGFICAECIKVEDLFRLGSEQKVKEAGLMRMEGKEYVVQPGDLLVFRFNV